MAAASISTHRNRSPFLNKFFIAVFPPFYAENIVTHPAMQVNLNHVKFKNITDIPQINGAV